MKITTQAFIIVAYLATSTVGSPVQVPLQVNDALDAEAGITTKPKKLHGRFLHITDLHPDPHYKAGTSTLTSCHRKGAKDERGLGKAGYWGTPIVECDAPLRLTNLTLDYLDDNWSDEIDFVIWTGDNARHDEDHKVPRTPSEIFDLNRYVAGRMEKIFLKKGIPVVPSLGNNDIWPHNIMTPGPNSITNEFVSIWSAFVPFPQRQVFQRGAYFSAEVIPGRVAVVSLNTIYFYDSNKAVGGCPYHDPEDAGNLQLDWLEVQLKMYRNKNMQVYLSGHIPPSPGMYFPECYVRYVELSLRFQDTILGHQYGHMNFDFFLFVEEIDLQIIPEEEAPVRKLGANDGLYETLLAEFAHLPKDSEGDKLDGLAVINAAPAAVPNPYVPGFRVFSYNVSSSALLDATKKRHHGHRRGRKGDKDKHCKEEPWSSSWKCHLREPWHSDADAPSRSNQAFTPLGYAQYYMPKVATANETHPPKFKLEYLTYPLSALHPMESGDSEFYYPVPVRHLPRSLRDGKKKIGELKKKKKYVPYEMKDLTIGSYVELGRRLADVGHGKLRRQFRKYMFVSS